MAHFNNRSSPIALVFTIEKQKHDTDKRRKQIRHELVAMFFFFLLNVVKANEE